MAAPASSWSRGLEVVHSCSISSVNYALYVFKFVYNFVNDNRNSRNVSEGEEVLKSRQILAVGYSKKTGKTREILKIMWSTMECERDSFSDLGRAKETHWDNSLVLQTSDTFSTYDHRQPYINHNNFELKYLISFLQRISTRNQFLWHYLLTVFVNICIFTGLYVQFERCVLKYIYNFVLNCRFNDISTSKR